MPPKTILTQEQESKIRELCENHTPYQMSRILHIPAYPIEFYLVNNKIKYKLPEQRVPRTTVKAGMFNIDQYRDYKFIIG